MACHRFSGFVLENSARSLAVNQSQLLQALPSRATRSAAAQVWCQSVINELPVKSWWHSLHEPGLSCPFDLKISSCVHNWETCWLHLHLFVDPWSPSQKTRLVELAVRPYDVLAFPVSIGRVLYRKMKSKGKKTPVLHSQRLVSSSSSYASSRSAICLLYIIHLHKVPLKSFFK